MTLEGRIENGQLVLESRVELPEGTRVRVEILPALRPEASLPSLYERLKPIIGAAEGLPADFAAQHDHYIHGVPKR